MSIDIITLTASKNYTDKQIEKASIGGVDLSGYVQSINGIIPDENGNVEITTPDCGGNVNQSGGLSDTAKTLLITILRNAIYSTDQSANITLLETALSSGGNGGGSEGSTQYSVTNNLTNVTNSNVAVTAAENGMYIATLTAINGYSIDSVTVTMGGVDVTASVYSGGAVTIASVTGDIVITASAVEAGGYIQSGLLYEFTDLTTSRTIAGGQSIFNSENDFTVFASCAGKSVNIISEPSENNQFFFQVNWQGKFMSQVYLTEPSWYPQINFGPSDMSGEKVYRSCIVKRGNDYSLYVDGETNPAGTMGSGGKHYILDGDLVINSGNDQIEKILIYDRALSEGEISVTFNAIKLEVGE